MSNIKKTIATATVAATGLAASTAAFAGIEVVRVSEPSTFALLGLALAGVAIARKLRK